MTQTIGTPQETSPSLRRPALISHERRINPRKAPEQLIYLSLPLNNGGIVLDVSEGGLGFHSIAPVERDGPIHFRFAIDSGEKIRGVGELAWIDKTGKTGGLRFTQLPNEVRDQIRVWTGQSKSTSLTATATEQAVETANMTTSAASRALDLTAGDSAPQLGAALERKSGYVFSAGVLLRRPENAAQVPLETKLGVATVAGTLVAEPLIESEIDYETRDDFPPMWEARNPLLYNATPPIYSAPFNELSLFPLNPNVEPRITTAELLEPIAALESAARRSPIAAVALTVVLAFFTAIGIAAYMFTSGVGELLMSWGQEIRSGSRSQPVSQNPAAPVDSAPHSFGDGRQ